MRVGSFWRRLHHRVLKTCAIGLGLVLVGTASCSDEVLSTILTSLQELTLSLIQVGFESVQFGFEEDTSSAVTVEAVRSAIEYLLT